MTAYRAGAFAAALLVVLLASCGGGGGDGAAASSTPTVTTSSLTPPAPPAVVADAAREARPGLNGVRASLAFTADWDAGLCTTLTIFNRHPSAALTAWQATIDLGTWTLQSTSGGRAAASTGIVTFKSEALGSAIAAGGTGQARLCMQASPTATVATRRPVLVSIASDLPPVSADPYESGLWRIAATESRLTTGWSGNGRFLAAGYSGHPDQQWRLKAQGTRTYQLVLESRGQCMSNTGAAVSLVNCGDANTQWTLETLRARTDERPALHRLHRGEQGCLRLEDPTAAAIGACGTEANLYVEPVGYGERAHEAEFELRGLLLIKPSTDVAVPRMIGTIPADTIAAIQIAYRDHLAVWFDRLTDGRIRWVGDSVVASPMTAATTEGEGRLPAAATMPDDVSRFLPLGRYDTAAVFFTAGVDERGAAVNGGWGWGPGISAASNYTMWVLSLIHI